MSAAEDGLGADIELLLLRHAEDVDAATLAALPREPSQHGAAGCVGVASLAVAGDQPLSQCLGSIRPGKRPARCFAADPLPLGPRDPVLTERGLQSLVTVRDRLAARQISATSGL